jgi:transposase
MTNYREILRQANLGILKKDIAASCGCSRNTVAATLTKAAEAGLGWGTAQGMTNTELSARLFPKEAAAPHFKMPDYEAVHREMGKSGVTLSLLWAEYREACQEAGDIPYKLTQFKKYYAGYVQKTYETQFRSHNAHQPQTG